MIFAYLDPGSGSLILQALVGGAAGIAVAWRAWRAKLSGKTPAAVSTDQPESEDDALTSET